MKTLHEAAPEPLTSDQEKALSAEAKTGPFQHTTPSYGNDMQSGETPRLSSKRHAGSTPPAAPADDHATPSGGQEAGPQEDRIEAAYWRFDARRSGYSQWSAAPMSERDAFKAEMRNALEAEKVRAEMRLVARGWRRPDAPAAPAPAAPVVPLTKEQLAKIAVEDELLLYCDQDSFNEIARAIELAHGITGASK